MAINHNSLILKLFITTAQNTTTFDLVVFLNQKLYEMTSSYYIFSLTLLSIFFINVWYFNN